MSNQAVKELADLLKTLSHPLRLQIVQELRKSEMDVSSLQQILSISHAGVSQHLALLRAHKLITERRAGKHVFYSLPKPDLAAWLLDGLHFIAPDGQNIAELQSAIEETQSLWSNTDNPQF